MKSIFLVKFYKCAVETGGRFPCLAFKLNTIFVNLIETIKYSLIN